MDNKSEKAIQGLEYARNLLNSITVQGVDNCQKISVAYNNISIFLSMLSNGEILTADNEKNTEQ